MASWFDLKGTVKDFFHIGIKKTKFDASAPTVQRNFFLPDASVDMTGGTVGQVLSKLTATTIGWANAGGGGGGYTEIANNGTISGSYDGNVHCLGNVTITGDLTVKGSLYVVGKTTNLVGADVTVYGDCTFAGEVDFQTNTGVAPGNIDIKGNFYSGESSQAYLNSIRAGYSDFAIEVDSFSSSITTSDNFFTLSGDATTVYPFPVVGDHVKCVGGPNDGQTRVITNIFFNGVDTEFTTTSFANNFVGGEAFTLSVREVFKVQSVTATADFGGGHKFTFNTGLNAGTSYIASSTNVNSPFTEVRMSTSTTNDLAIGDTLTTKTFVAFRTNEFNDQKFLFKLTWQQPIKFSGTSNNPSANSTIATLAQNGISLETNGYARYVLSSELPNIILDTDKFYTLSDMGMLFTWDTGPSPSINVGGDYATVGGIKAFPISGNLDGADVTIKGSLYSQISSLGSNVGIGSILNVSPSGTGVGGDVNVGGEINNISVITAGRSALNTVGGVGGNLTCGSFKGYFDYDATLTSQYQQFCNGNIIDLSGSVTYQNTNTVKQLRNGGSLVCKGELYCASVSTAGGEILYDPSNTTVGFNVVFSNITGGNAGDISVAGEAIIAYGGYFHGGCAGVNGLPALTINLKGNLVVNRMYVCASDLPMYNAVSQSNSSANIGFKNPNHNTAIASSICVLGANVSIIRLEHANSVRNGEISGIGPIEGNGRSMLIFGNVSSLSDQIISTGGSIQTTTPGLVSGNAGNITINGNCQANLFAIAGETNFLDGSHNSGSGGNITVRGHYLGQCTTRGSGALNNGGNAGAITITGNCVLALNSEGGSGTSGVGGNGGTITVSGDSGPCISNGGNGTVGGNGGNIIISKNANGSVFSCNGGNGSAGAGGNAGIIDVTNGTLLATSTISCKGGNGTTGTGRTGGNVICGSIMGSAAIDLSGGNGTVAGSCGNFRVRSGVQAASITAIDGTGTASALARTIEFNGYCVLNSWNIQNRTTVRIRSKNTFTTAPNAILFCPTRTGKTVLTKSSGTETAASTQAMFYNGTDWNNFTSTVQA